MREKSKIPTWLSLLPFSSFLSCLGWVLFASCSIFLKDWSKSFKFYFGVLFFFHILFLFCHFSCLKQPAISPWKKKFQLFLTNYPLFCFARWLIDYLLVPLAKLSLLQSCQLLHPVVLPREWVITRDLQPSPVSPVSLYTSTEIKIPR